LVNAGGDHNIGIGSQALTSNTGGLDNIAIGYQAMAANVGSAENVAIGTEALRQEEGTGDLNTAVGYFSLLFNNGGVGNAAFGTSAGATNTTGSHNTFVGAGADSSVGDLIDATAVGANTVVNASHKVRIGGENVTL